MNYQKIYNQIISKRSVEPLESIKGQTERHHIIPRSMGGTKVASKGRTHSDETRRKIGEAKACQWALWRHAHNKPLKPGDWEWVQKELLHGYQIT